MLESLLPVSGSSSCCLNFDFESPPFSLRESFLTINLLSQKFLSWERLPRPVSLFQLQSLCEQERLLSPSCCRLIFYFVSCVSIERRRFDSGCHLPNFKFRKLKVTQNINLYFQSGDAPPNCVSSSSDFGEISSRRRTRQMETARKQKENSNQRGAPHRRGKLYANYLLKFNSLIGRHHEEEEADNYGNRDNWVTVPEESPL